MSAIPPARNSRRDLSKIRRKSRQLEEGLSAAQTARKKKPAWETEFYGLLKNAKTALKEGWPPDKLRDNLRKLDRAVATHGKTLRIRDELNYLKSKCIIAETYDYIGDTESSKNAVSEGEQILEELKGLNTQHSFDRKIVRERIRLCLDHTHALFYRTYQYDIALERVEWCRKFVVERLQDPKEFPCFGTLAKAEHNLGRIHMRTNEYGEAEACFAESIRYYRLRAERMKIERAGDSRKLEEEMSFSNHKMGICLGLGLGQTNFLRGHLTTALRSNLETARHLLAGTKDELHTAYLNLLEGSVRRSLAGTKNTDELGEAIRIIKASYVVFEKYPHKVYMARAAFELSLAYLNNNKLDEAEIWAKAVEAASDDPNARGEAILELWRKLNHLRWRCQTSTVRSRIARKWGQYDEAEALASCAFDSAKEANQVLSQIEARIARGEVRILLGKIDDARSDFQEALTLNTKPGLDGEEKQSNPKIEAVCNVHLARCDTRERKIRSAEKHFERWRELRGQVEHGIIHEMALEVEKEIQELKEDFSIRADDPDLRWERRKRELQRWLIQQALSRGLTTKVEISDALNVARQTVDQWEKRSPELKKILVTATK